jgi:hypothetical protein
LIIESADGLFIQRCTFEERLSRSRPLLEKEIADRLFAADPVEKGTPGG